MRTGPDGVLHLAVQGRAVAGWVLALAVVAAAGLADLRWGSGAVAVACLAVVLLVGTVVLPPVLGSVSAHPEGHLVVRWLLASHRYEMEEIDSVVVAPAGPQLSGSALFGQRGIALFARGAELVLFSGAEVPLRSTQVLVLPPLLRRLDREVAALQAWLDEGPA
ncbi:hypothetical protein [Klenkia taihuensis]|uniref:PH domain-containing protein n=1 Tax=Klenkia taihuensis TaxID=1225127 RepID=A0A1I1HCJ4_9ACTN|nr:hypothetical protein [Klenkia taihuensis]GHE09397.1 hypothetical protein GCM10011381_14020 [Klenkia taihuensis]SFC18850.1 hypothetical protein SAMN05661030_0333 [Klenkia taihuensis]